jgi:hypothetical protein
MDMGRLTEVEVLRLQGSGNGLIVKGIRSKREREFIIDKIIKSSIIYRKFYKIRNSVS